MFLWLPISSYFPSSPAPFLPSFSPPFSSPVSFLLPIDYFYIVSFRFFLPFLSFTSAPIPFFFLFFLLHLIAPFIHLLPFRFFSLSSFFFASFLLSICITFNIYLLIIPFQFLGLKHPLPYYFPPFLIRRATEGTADSAIQDIGPELQDRNTGVPSYVCLPACLFFLSHFFVYVLTCFIYLNVYILLCFSLSVQYSLSCLFDCLST